MPRRKNTLPKYRLHQASGHARTQIGGKEFWLGKFDSPESRRLYDELIAQWLQEGRPTNWRIESEDETAKPNSPITVNELVALYAEHLVRRWPAPEGRKEHREIANRRPIVRMVRLSYGDWSTADFGPAALQSIRERLVRAGAARTHINRQMGVVKQMFKWGVSRELVPPDRIHALASLEGLRRGELGAVESKPILPVSDELIDQTLPHCPHPVDKMVELQRLTGARPCEICLIRPSEIDRRGDVWVFRPKSHKNAHRGKLRSIAIGPKAQAILLPFLSRDEEACCFSPRQAMRDFHKQRVEQAKTHKNYTKVDTPRREPGDHYTTESYRRAIHRACQKAGAQQWSPNQLRHKVATEVREQFGLDSAQVVLGHSHARTTEIYAELNEKRAIAVMKEIG